MRVPKLSLQTVLGKLKGVETEPSKHHPSLVPTSKVMSTPRTSEQDERWSCFHFSFFHFFWWIWWFSTNHQCWMSLSLRARMLPADRFSSCCLPAPEFWKQEELHAEGGRIQSSPRDAFSEPWPISGHDNSSHQRGGCGRAPGVWAWLLFCGGARGCDNWNNHTDHFCQGPRRDQQLYQVFPQISLSCSSLTCPHLLRNALAISPLVLPL